MLLGHAKLETTALRSCAQSSQRSTCPPSAAVRQVSIADMTFSWPRPTWPALALRHAAPWARKTSATSRRGRPMRPQSGGRRSAREVDAQPLERALDLADGADGDARIDRHREAPRPLRRPALGRSRRTDRRCRSADRRAVLVSFRAWPTGGRGRSSGRSGLRPYMRLLLSRHDRALPTRGRATDLEADCCGLGIVVSAASAA